MDSALLERAAAERIEVEASRRRLKLRRASSVESVGPCPRCGGDDRFGVNRAKQVFLCRGCGAAGDVIDMVKFLDGCDFATACRTLAGEGVDNIHTRSTAGTLYNIQGSSPQTEQITVDNIHGDSHERAAEIWRAASPIEDTPVTAYLKGRGLEVLDGLSGRVLRYHPACPFLDHTTDPPKRITVPAMVALFRSIHGDEPVGIHRTALTLDGRKAALPKVRLSLGSIEGAAIKLSPDADVESRLTIGEGVESCIAGMLLWFSPCWALGSSGKIGRFPVLSGIESLTILVDHDDIAKSKKGSGQIQARECSARWTGAGREVFRVTPVKPGTDLVDALPILRSKVG